MTRQGYIKIDPESQGVITISNDHAHIHRGKAFYYSVNDIVVDVGESIDVLFVVGNEEPHIIGSTIIITSAPFVFHTYENVVVTDNGTADEVRNVKRASDKTSSISVYRSPTVSSYGDHIDHHSIPGGKLAGTIVSEGLGELNLKPNTNYVFQFENKSGIASDLGIRINWYE